MKQLVVLLVILIQLLLSNGYTIAQDTLMQQQGSIPQKSKSKKISRIVKSLEKSYSENDLPETAKNYESLAKAYAD